MAGYERYMMETSVERVAEVVACAYPHVDADTLAQLVVDVIDGRRSEMWPGVDDLRWEQDKAAQRCVAFLGPMRLEQIGAAMGLSRERVRQLEQAAMRKIKHHAGTDGKAVVERLQAIDAERQR